MSVWSDVEANSGVQVAAVPHTLAATDTRRIDGRDRLQVTIAIDALSWPEVTVGRVLRVVLPDDTVEEWRITSVTQEEGDQGPQAVVQAEGILLDLLRGVVTQTLADGTVAVEFEVLGLTPSSVITNYILPASPSYFALGTVDPTEDVPIQFDGDSPLTALRALAESTHAEITVRRNGATNYLVDLVDTVGASAPLIDFRHRKNVRAVTYELDAGEQTTRVYPRGGDIDGIRLGIERAQWEVVSVTSNDVVLTAPDGNGDPIAFDDQLNGTYLRRADGVLIQVSDTIFASQTVTLASAPGLSPGDLVEFRLNASGDQLTFLNDPASQAVYGLIPRTLLRDDIPHVRNVVLNPGLVGTYTAGLPPNWFAVGAPTLAENTNPLYTQVGGQSVHVTAAVDEGIQTAALTIVPSADRPYFSGYFQLWLVSGSVRVEMIDETNSRTYPTGAEGRAVTTERGVWVALGVAGIDLQEVACNSVRLRVVADVASGAEFYVDAAQLTQTAGQEPFLNGDGALRLWRAGNAHLMDFGPPVVTVRIDVLDLTRLDPTAWPHVNIALGGPVQVVHAGLGLNVTTRVLERSRDLLHDATASVVLSNQPDELSDVRVRPFLRRRFGAGAAGRFDLIGIADPSIGPSEPGAGVIVYPVLWDPDTAYIEVYTVEDATSSVQTPPETGEYSAGTYTPEAAAIQIATTASWFRKTKFVAYTRDNVRGRTTVLGPDQETTTGGPSAGPSGLACNTPTATTVPLSWTNNDTTAQTRVYKNGVVIQTVNPGVASYTAIGLTPATTYAFKVAHVKGGVEHPTTSSADCTTTSNTLAAPNDIHAFGDSVDGVLLSVSVSEPSAHTIIARSPNGTTGWVEIVDWGPGQCGGDDASQPSGTFFFRAFHRKEGYTDSSPTSNNQAEYFVNETPESFFPCP